MRALETRVTFLQMFARPDHRLPPPAGHKLMLLRSERPTVPFYRFLYEGVGRPWVWVNRRRLNDEALAAAIQQPGLEIYVLYVDGTPAGYAELDARNRENIELAYFGLMPDFTSIGLGPFFLSEAIALAWDKGPKRVHVQTCTLDHPSALPLYQRMGFTPFDQITAYVEPIGDEPHPRVLAQKTSRSA